MQNNLRIFSSVLDVSRTFHFEGSDLFEKLDGRFPYTVPIHVLRKDEKISALYGRLNERLLKFISELDNILAIGDSLTISSSDIFVLDIAPKLSRTQWVVIEKYIGKALQQAFGLKRVNVIKTKRPIVFKTA